MRRISIIWLIVFGLIFGNLGVASAAEGEAEWEVVVPGIEFRHYQLADPNDIFVVRMERANTSVTLESSIALGKISSGLETVSGMFARYDQALNYWGGSADPLNWGMRNQVVVAINGGYTEDDGSPQGGQVYSGWYAKRFDDFGGRTGFGWMLDRTPFIGECVYHRAEKQQITYVASGVRQQFSGINRERDANELILFTPQYNSRTGTDDTGVEVLVEMARPTMVLPDPAHAAGYVREIRNNAGNSLIPFNYIVLSAHGTAAQTLLDNAQLGGEVRVSQEINACDGYDPMSWTKTYASIQGDYFFLKNGVIVDYTDEGATNHHPRTALAYNDQYIFFIVVDGRHRYVSVGMPIHDLAVFTHDTLGAMYGVAEDGGGSSTMVINGERVNNTYCNQWGCLGEYTKAYLPVVLRNWNEGMPINPVDSETDIGTGHERPVPNGMLMIVAQPAEHSTVFSPGNSVTAKSNLELRLGPGSNYASFTTIPAGTQGTILTQMNGLAGVLATGAYWWSVDFAGVKGWVAEGSILP